MRDDLTRTLQDLSGDVPEPRLSLSDNEKDQLVARIGPKTARSILKAKKDFPLRRIPFLFSSLDTQDVVDILNNEMAEAIDRALRGSQK